MDTFEFGIQKYGMIIWKLYFLYNHSVESNLTIDCVKNVDSKLSRNNTINESNFLKGKTHEKISKTDYISIYRSNINNNEIPKSYINIISNDLKLNGSSRKILKQSSSNIISINNNSIQNKNDFCNSKNKLTLSNRISNQSIKNLLDKKLNIKKISKKEILNTFDQNKSAAYAKIAKIRAPSSRQIINDEIPRATFIRESENYSFIDNSNFYEKHNYNKLKKPVDFKEQKIYLNNSYDALFAEKENCYQLNQTNSTILRNEFPDENFVLSKFVNIFIINSEHQDLLKKDFSYLEGSNYLELSDKRYKIIVKSKSIQPQKLEFDLKKFLIKNDEEEYEIIRCKIYTISFKVYFYVLRVKYHHFR